MIVKQYSIFGHPYLPEDEIVPSMPYMGGKRKLATKIINAMYETVGDFGTLYDLFGGGGAVSVAAMLAGHTVHYNELNTGVANLMRHIVSGGYLPDHWIDRDTFTAVKDGDSWYSGFVKVCWSFGNNQKDYLFGRGVEPIKKLGHFAVVYNCERSRRELSSMFGVELPDGVTRNQLNRLANDRITELEQLQRLQQLQQLQQLHITNASYKDVAIDGACVIYCDPPYEGTAQYQSGIDHEEFYQWCLDTPHPVFVSGYEVPYGMIQVATYKHQSTLSATATNEVVEVLSWNGRGMQ